MRYAFLLIVLLLFGCDNKQTEKEPETTTSEPKPKPDKVKEKPAEAKPEDPCAPFASRAPLDAWVKKLQKELDDKKIDDARETAKCLSKEADPKFRDDSVRQKVEVFEGQLDTDEAPEWVVQVRQHSEEIGHGEREHDYYWVSVLDERDGKYGVVHSFDKKMWVCAIPDKLGVKLGFSNKKPGKDASLWVVEQKPEACGTLVDVWYEKRTYQIVDGKVVVKTVDPPKSQSWDRTSN